MKGARPIVVYTFFVLGFFKVCFIWKKRLGKLQRRRRRSFIASSSSLSFLNASKPGHRRHHPSLLPPQSSTVTLRKRFGLMLYTFLHFACFHSFQILILSVVIVSVWGGGKKEKEEKYYLCRSLLGEEGRRIWRRVGGRRQRDSDAGLLLLEHMVSLFCFFRVSW